MVVLLPRRGIPFSGLPPGTYILYIGFVLADIFTVDAGTDLKLGDLRMPLKH